MPRVGRISSPVSWVPVLPSHRASVDLHGRRAQEGEDGSEDDTYEQPYRAGISTWGRARQPPGSNVSLNTIEREMDGWMVNTVDLPCAFFL